MGPGAMFASVLGAELTHRMPTKWLKFVVAAVLSAAAVRLIVG
jgi:uncharacterized membrane protein YfcA